MTLVGVVAGVTLDTAGTWATLTSCWELRGGLGVGIVGGDGHDFLVARITLIPVAACDLGDEGLIHMGPSINLKKKVAIKYQQPIDVKKNTIGDGGSTAL